VFVHQKKKTIKKKKKCNADFPKQIHSDLGYVLSCSYP
jgi:hypothetical protein